MTKLVKITALVTSVAFCSCAPCTIVAGINESDAKAKLIRCMGRPDMTEEVDPGGPFLWKTEIWIYFKGSKKESYWFANGKLQSGPICTFENHKL